MKSNIFCAFLIATLLFSVAAFGELVEVPGETEGSESASSSYGDEYDYNWDSGDNGYYTTEEGYFSFHLEAWATAYAKVVIDDGWAVAATGGHGYAQSSTGESVDASASLYITWTGGGIYPDFPDPIDETRHFEAYEGVLASWDVFAETQIEEGSSSSAECTGKASASASMS